MTDEEPDGVWADCPHCGARLRIWDKWYGAALWVRDCNGMEPVMEFRHCPNCGEELERSGSDD